MGSLPVVHIDQMYVDKRLQWIQGPSCCCQPEGVNWPLISALPWGSPGLKAGRRSDQSFQRSQFVDSQILQWWWRSAVDLHHPPEDEGQNFLWRDNFYQGWSEDLFFWDPDQDRVFRTGINISEYHFFVHHKMQKLEKMVNYSTKTTWY